MVEIPTRTNKQDSLWRRWWRRKVYSVRLSNAVLADVSQQTPDCRVRRMFAWRRCALWQPLYNVFSRYRMRSLTVESVGCLRGGAALCDNHYRVCSLTIECVLWLQNVFSHYRMCFLTIDNNKKEKEKRKTREFSSAPRYVYMCIHTQSAYVYAHRLNML